MTETKIKIESGVRIPPQHRQPLPNFPWREMAIGDSFSVSDAALAGAARDAAAKFKLGGRVKGWNYTSRKLPDGTYRFWRTA